MTGLAELATPAAAQAFAAYGRMGEFEALFNRIEAAGFPLGIEGRLRCLVVLSRLVPLGVEADATRLANYLVPVLATSAHEQRSIHSLILEWGGQVGPSDIDQRRRQAAAPRAVAQLERGERRVALLSRVLIGAAVLGIAAILMVNIFGGESATATHAAASVVTYSQPILSLDVGLHPFWKALIEDAISRFGFALAVLLGGLSFIAWRDEIRGRLVRQTDQTDLIERFQLKAPAPDWFRSADARAAFDRLKRVRLFDTDRIDVMQTVAVSTRAGGLPLIAIRRRQELPNYVLLIDRAALDDLIGIFGRAMEAALSDARIVYSRYDFNGALDRLYPVRGGAQEDIVDQDYMPFSAIASRHAGERLILIGTGTSLFETPGFRYDRILRRRTLVKPGTPVAQAIHLREFSATFLITPAPVSAWGDHENRLRALGLQIVSADVDGIQTLATGLLSDPDSGPKPSPILATDADKFLELLDRDAMRLSAATPPPAAEIDRLVLNIRIWSGDATSYTLLGAIAAFPKIDTAFTFVLARMLLGREMDSALFARLARLPWIRNGYLPDWLRIAIVNALDSEQLARVQEVQLAMLKGTEQQLAAPADAKIPWRDQLVANFEVARELPAGQLQQLVSHIPAKDLHSADERIFFSVLRGHRLDPELEVISPEAPEVVAERFDAPERARRRRIRLAVAGLAILAAALQPWISVGLAAGAQAVIANLRAVNDQVMGILGPGSYSLSASTLRVTAIIAMLLGMGQWAVNVSRSTPTIFHSVRELSQQSLKQWLWDARIPSIYLLLAGFGGLTRPASAGGAIASGTTMDAVILIIGGIMFVWASLVTPERWWNSASADGNLALQLQRDPLTGALGTLLVVAIWAVPWVIEVLAGLDEPIASSDRLFLAVCIGATSWVASNALARRWLLGRAATFSPDRVWIDGGFGTLAVLIMGNFYPLLMPLNVVPYFLFLLVTPALLYIFLLKASLGLRRTRPVWGPLINGLAAGVMVVGLSTIALRFSEESSMILGLYAAGGLVFGAVTAFQFRRSDYSGSSDMALRVRCVLIGGGLFALVMTSGDAVTEWLIRSSLAIAGISVDSNFAIVTWFVLPASLALWPMFRLLAPTFRLEAPMPMWRRIADSPWWATPLMWIAGIIWHVGTMRFSIWPLMLLIAAITWRRQQQRAVVPIAVGTAPLLLRLSDAFNDSFSESYTPGGVWPALAILLLARLVGDGAFRERLLRREHLSWFETILLVLLLAPTLAFTLASFDIGELYLPDIVRKAFGLTGLPSFLQVTISVDPLWMLTAVAVILGASRMPIARFAVALLAAWLLPDIKSWISGHGPQPATTIGLQAGTVASLWLLLYGIRAWRSYAARRVVLSDRRASLLKAQGIYLSCGAAICVAIFASGLVPTLDLLRIDSETSRIDWTFWPSLSATLALVVLTGLIASDLWNRGGLSPIIVDRQGIDWRLISPVLAPVAAALAYLPIARWLGATAIEPFGFVEGGSDLGAIGFTVSATTALMTGIGLRILAEQRGVETWQMTARRLWIPLDPSADAGSDQLSESGRSAATAPRSEAATNDFPPEAATPFEPSAKSEASARPRSSVGEDPSDDDLLPRSSTAELRRQPKRK